MATKQKDHTKSIEVIKKSIKDLKKQVNIASKNQDEKLSAKDKETTPQDHQAALDHFSFQYKIAKMNGQEDKAKEYAKSYHEYAAKLDKHYHAKINEIGDPEEMYKKAAATSTSKLQAMKAMDKTRKYELERKYNKPEPKKDRPSWLLSKGPLKMTSLTKNKANEELEMNEAKKFGYDAINARFKKKTGKSLEDKIKHYEELSARLKKQQDEYEASNKKQNEALDWGSMSKSEFKRRELEHELRHEPDDMAKVRANKSRSSLLYAKSRPYRSPEEKEPHAVHINGKKWKTFSSQSHAQNVANKIKGATVHKEETEHIQGVVEGSKKGLWDNIHAKRKRIKAGSGERMRKPGSEGAPTKQDFIDASK